MTGRQGIDLSAGGGGVSAQRQGRPGRGRWAVVLALAGLVLIVGFFAGDRARMVRAMPECPPERPIVIDPGHGGLDGGTNVPTLLEKDVVLDVALRTRTFLEQAQIPVLLTRSTDVDLGGKHDGGRLRRDLNYRIRLANHCRAALMLSLHVNSTGNQAERGMIIFYQGSRLSRDAAYFFDQTLRSGQLHNRQESPYPRTDFAVLRGTKAPAILVEMGFITNAADRELLSDSVYREIVAQSLSAACSEIYQKWLK
jgi:N-acetylmuramoyl-L-alanine amidase